MAQDKKIERLDFEGLRYYDERLKKYVRENGGGGDLGNALKWKRLGDGINYNGHDYVDMGEAGIWATCNVGASKPEEYGLYFAWGETKGYPDASSEKKFSWDDYEFGTSNNLTKYNSTDGLTTLELEDDAAHVNMGGDWRMPTKEEFQKLYDLCNNEWTTNYEGTGIEGIIFKLNTDESKQLFFPSCGKVNSGSLSFVKSRGFYWSSSKRMEGGMSYAFNLLSTSVKVDAADDNFRNNGFSIRGFIPPKAK